MASRKFGWHSGTVTAQDGKFKGDLYVQDDIVFSDVSAGVLGVTGGIDMQSTTSAIGLDLGGVFSTAAINIDGTVDLAINIDTDTTTADPGRQVYLQRDHTGALGDGKGLTGIEVRSTFNGSEASTTGEIKGGEFKARHTADNAFDVGAFKGIVGNCDSKTGAKTITSAWAVEGQIDCGTSSTITTAAGVRVAYNEDGTVTNAYGVYVDGTSVWDVGLKITDAKTTTGIEVGNCTTGLILGTATTGISFSDEVTTGINIGACATGITFTGACTTAAISMDSATFAAGDHDIELRNTVSGDKTVICAGTATDDAGIVTAVGADADIADGSLYMSCTDGAGVLFIKKDDVWTAFTNP